MKSTKLDEIYSAEWFSGDFEGLQPEFDVVADAIFRQFRPETAVDVGCGPGMVVARLRGLGVEASGIEGSAHGIAAAGVGVRPHLVHADITTERWLENCVDVDAGARALVICTEVAEHLDAADASGLVHLLCSAMSPIVFTAAPPGQDGHHHVNCQPQAYWLELFQAHGVILDEAATHELKTRWAGLKRLSHMVRNLMVLR